MSRTMKGDEIRSEREKRGWSQPQLAQLVGVSKSLISMWENGSQHPGDNQIEALIEAFIGDRGQPDARPPGRRRSAEAIPISAPQLDFNGVAPPPASDELSAVPDFYRRSTTATSSSNGRASMSADEIRTERKKRKWSQHELAERISATRALVADWEIGRRSPNETFVGSLRSVFNSNPTVVGDGEVKPRRRRSQAAVSESGDEPLTMAIDEMKDQRKLRGWSQQELANRSGLSRSLIGNWESGARGAHPNAEQTRMIQETFTSHPVGNDVPVAPKKTAGTRRSRAVTDNGSNSGNGESAKDMYNWQDAIERVLRDSGKPVHYVEIAQAIIDNKYRVNVTATPDRAVSAILSKSIKTKKEKSPFVQDGDGMYSLRTAKTKQKAPESRDEAKESAAEMGLIRSFGILWDREFVDWATSVPRLLGVKQAGSKPVNFAEQAGIYVLYDQSRPIYVGQAGDKRLAARLKEHTRGRFASRWNRFSWFGVRDVNPESGELEATPNRQEVSPGVLITTMEALLIESLEPTQNRRGGDYNAVEFIQEEDPNIKERQRKALFAEWQMNLFNNTTQ
jgi:transcriptional regulator with XRE-family HTH domain